MRISGFHHLAILVRDLPAAARFYSEVLGLLERQRHHRDDGTLRSIWLEVPQGGFLALEALDEASEDISEPPGAEPFRSSRPGLHLLALRIGADQRQAVLSRLQELAIPVAHQTRWTVYFRDPEGNRIALSHHPEDPPSNP
jgi:glyoxylase I family protein